MDEIISHQRKVLMAQYAERLNELVNGINGRPHSFEVNSLVAYLHDFALEEAGICDPEKAKSVGLNTYIENGGRVYVEVPQKELKV